MRRSAGLLQKKEENIMGTATCIARPREGTWRRLRWFRVAVLGATSVWTLVAMQSAWPQNQVGGGTSVEPAAAGGRSGQQVVEAVCVKCHASGANGAPKIGDQNAWSKRASQGLTSLTQHALAGIRRMPAHGGNPELTDLEISRAITYMVNRSGGHWIEPLVAGSPAAERSGVQVVQSQCVKCHENGINGAPKIGDRQAWLPRMKNGVDFLVRSAVHGHGGMPPRGGEADLSDAELRSAILYMFDPNYATRSQVGSAASKQSPSAPADLGPNHVVADNVDVFLGVVSAESLLGYPKGSVERSMHGGVPSGSDYYHVNVSLQDHVSQTPITDAQVAVQIEQAGTGATERGSKALELIAPLASYGNYVQFKRNTPYVITVLVRTPGAARPIEARFEQTFY